QREQQDQRRDVDAAADVVDGDGLGPKQRDRAEERDAGAVHPEPRQTSRRQTKVGQEENRQDDCIRHGDGTGRRVRERGGIIGTFAAQGESDLLPNSPPGEASWAAWAGGLSAGDYHYLTTYCQYDMVLA